MDNSALTAKLRAIKKTGVTYEIMARKIGVSLFTIRRWLLDGMSSNAHTTAVRSVIQFIAGWEAAKKLQDLDRFWKE